MRALTFSCALLCAGHALAVERIHVTAARVDVPAVKLRVAMADVDVRLGADGTPAIGVRAAQVVAPVGRWAGATLRCDVPRRAAPWGCDDARFDVRDSPVGAMSGHLRLRHVARTNRLEAGLTQGRIAGGALSLQALLDLDGDGWEVADARYDAALPDLARWLAPWWTAPTGVQFAGSLSLAGGATGHAGTLVRSRIRLQWRDLDLQEPTGRFVAEKSSGSLALRTGAIVAPRTGTLPEFDGDVDIESAGGQVLAGPVLLDAAAYPLRWVANLDLRGDVLRIRHYEATLRDLAEATGQAEVSLRAAPYLRSAQAEVGVLRFPAAYTTFLQLTLAPTPLGNLDASGSAAARVDIADDALRALDLTSTGIDFADAARGLGLTALRGDFHWTAAGQPAPPPSTLRWDGFRAIGLAGGAARLQVQAQADRLGLVEPARIPVFDGALAIQRFDASHLGSSDLALVFDGRIDAVGMPQLSRAFGWPEMTGTLSGRLPGLELRAGELSVAGDLSAQVFDGTIVASDLRLRNAFSRFPRFSGNFRARGLDLGQITRTFPIGSITGRLDADVAGLELFGWSPVAFDASLFSTPGDRTRHRISQRAVGSLANLNGGGGGVVAILQSGFLRFFDDFGYDRIGLRCQLRNDVCLMSGIPRPDGGFYIVKGGGLPRLDVVGNAGRIAWSQLISQVGAALENGQLEVR